MKCVRGFVFSQKIHWGYMDGESPKFLISDELRCFIISNFIAHHSYPTFPNLLSILYLDNVAAFVTRVWPEYLFFLITNGSQLKLILFPNNIITTKIILFSSLSVFTMSNFRCIFFLALCIFYRLIVIVLLAKAYWIKIRLVDNRILTGWLISVDLVTLFTLFIIFRVFRLD